MPETLYRELTVDATRRDAESRSVPASLSSTHPVRRYFGLERLRHDDDAVDLSRAPLPLLFDHDRREVVGSAANLRLDGDRLRATLRFARTARADEIWSLISDGHLRGISIGYSVDDMQRAGDRDGEPVFDVTRWTPLEATVTAIPADHTVGVGRNRTEAGTMTDEAKAAADSGAEKRAAKRAVDVERNRVADIMALATRHNMRQLGEKAVAEGMTVEHFKGAVLARLDKGGGDKPLYQPPAELGLSDGEAERFSIMRAIRAQYDPKLLPQAGFELECSRAIAQRHGRDPQGFYLPADVFRVKRDLNTTDDSALTPTVHMGDLFVDLLRNATRVRQVGATVLTGLRGKSISIPRQTASATAAWVAEGSATTESEATFDTVTLSPESVTCWTDMTRKMLLESDPSVENIVRADLANTIGVEIDRVAIDGSGSGNEPEGILNTAGIGSVDLGVNGGAPTWDAVVELESDVDVANALLGRLAYLTNANGRSVLKRTLKVSGDAGAGYLWQDGREVGQGIVNGYLAATSNNVPNDLTDGTGTNLSAVIFGNFADLLIGEFSGLDLLVDRTTLGTSGGVRLIVFMDLDIAVRHAESFSAIQDMDTSYIRVNKRANRQVTEHSIFVKNAKAADAEAKGLLALPPPHDQLPTAGRAFLQSIRRCRNCTDSRVTVRQELAS